MKKVVDVMQVRPVSGDVGVEIEVEGKNLLAIDGLGWHSTNDGSLRGRYPDQACEYVMKNPVNVDKVSKLVTSLREYLKDSKMDFSYRTSVHVHVNVQQLEWQQLLAMMYTYYLIEEPLVTFAGKARKGNNFCLRLQDAEGVLDSIGYMFGMGPDGVQAFPKDLNRYAALNIDALFKYGSLEFRCMEGNMDVERIQTWCSALVAVREYGRKLDNPEAVYESFKRLGTEKFLNDVLGGLGNNFIYARVDRDMEKSFSLSIDLPFLFKKFKKEKEENKKERAWKIGDEISQVVAVKLNEEGYGFDYIGGNRYRIRALPKKVKVPEFEFPQVLIDDMEFEAPPDMNLQPEQELRAW